MLNLFLQQYDWFNSILFCNAMQKSTNNHFMFWKRKPGMGKDFKEPTSFDRKMGFEKWLAKAYEADEKKLEAESEHLYFHKVCFSTNYNVYSGGLQLLNIP
jgi:hypothetical protein